MASFTTQVKDEITKIETSRLESISELCAYIHCNATIAKTITLFIENASVARRMFNLLKRLYGVDIILTIRSQKKFHVKNIYILEIKDKVSFISDDVSNNVANIKTYSDEEKAAFLKGVFLACGSINDPSKSKYHLEFLLEDKDMADKTNSLLHQLSFKSKVLKRDKGYMVYIKASEEISDFIKLMGAINALFYYEDIRIYRDHKNMVNRINNCEQANVEKSMRTCLEQVKNIEYVKKNDLFSLFDEKSQIIMEYRLKYPETTLGELAQIISVETDYHITKSGINHHFRKIKELVGRHREDHNK